MARLQILKSRLHVDKPQQPQQQSKWGSGRGGRPWRRLRDKVFLRDNYTCRSCGQVTMDLECDHIINTAKGGTDDLDNLQSLCIDCHKKKTQTESKDFSGI